MSGYEVPPRYEGIGRNISDELWASVNELLAAPEFAQHLPKFLAKGGEHLVFLFEPPKHKDIVCKVNFSVTVDLLKRYLATPNAEAQRHELEQGQKVIQERLVARRERLRRLGSAQYLGSGSVPAEHAMLRVVPISPDVIRALGFSDANVTPEHLPKFFPVLMTIQRRVEGLDRAVFLHGVYMEHEVLERYREFSGSPSSVSRQRSQLLGKYRQQHQALMDTALFDFSTEEDISANRDFVVQVYPALYRVRQALETPGSNMEDALRETVCTLVRYTRDTGEALDMMGSKNIVLLHCGTGENASWNVKILDAVQVPPCLMSEAVHAALKMKRNQRISRDGVVQLMNALNTIRVINALAILVGIKESLIVPEFMNLNVERWIKEVEHQNFWGSNGRSA